MAARAIRLEFLPFRSPATEIRQAFQSLSAIASLPFRHCTKKRAVLVRLVYHQGGRNTYHGSACGLGGGYGNWVRYTETCWRA